MSLLQGLLGFGAGAAAGMADLKREEISNQRKANLARLQAQYKGEAEAQKQADAEKRRREILETENRGEAFTEALIAGETGLAEALAPAEAPKPTAAQKDAEAIATARGLQKGTEEYNNYIANYLEQAGGPSVTNINLPQQGQEAFITAVGKQDAERLEQIETRANRSMDQMAELDRIKVALDSGQFTTGAASSFRYGLGQWATLFGMDPSEIPLIGNPVTADTIEASTELIAANLVGDITQNASMRGSTALLEMARNAGPQLSRTLEGNAILVEVMQRKAQREIEVASLAQEYVRMGSFRPEGRPSFMDAIVKLNQEDPIVTEELEERIKSAKDAAPSSQQMAEQIGDPYPRVNFSADASSGLSQQEVNARLDALGVKPGEKFMDSKGRVVTRPGGR